MFSKCKPCRCFSQVIPQMWSMDIKFLIYFSSIVCFLAGYATSDVSTSTSASIVKNNFSLPCRLGKRDVQKPLRAHVFYREPYRFENMIGFVDSYSQEELKGPVDKTRPIQQRYLIQLGQKVEKMSVMQMRLDIYARHNYSQPLNITFVLHSSSALSWTLSMSHLLASVRSTAPSTVLVILTHRRSLLALEQLHLPGWRIFVVHQTPPTKAASAEVTDWAERELFGGLPLTLAVRFPASHFSKESARLPLELVNALDLTLLPSSTPPVTAGPGDRLLRRVLHNKTDLSNWLTGFIDISLDDGFTSCHTPGMWRRPSVPASGGGSARTMLLQTLEFGPDFAIPGSKGKLAVQLRVQTDALTAAGPRLRVLALYGRPDRLKFMVDLRGLSGELIIHTNLKDTFVILSPQGRHHLVEEPAGLSEEAFLTRVAAHHSPAPLDSPLWQVERVRFARLPHTPISARTTFIDVSLSMKPLMLRDLECIVHSQCFNTEDLAISLDARSFQAIGLTRDQVRLGGQQCIFTESSDGRWVRKLLLMNGHPETKCGTQKFSQGKMVTLSNTIYISSSFHAKGVAPYPLPVQCTYATQSTIDLPPVEPGTAVVSGSGSSGDRLWSTWDGRGYGGPAPRRNARPGVHSAQLKLDLFKDAKMTRKIVFHYDRVQSGQKLFARLQPKDETVDYGLMVRDCFLSNTNKVNHPLGYPRQYLLIKGCDMGDSFRFQEALSFRVKTFSFETPRLNFFSMGPYIYLHCNVQPCNYGDRKQLGLPKCWNQYYLCNLPETPATAHLISVPLQNADGSKREGGGTGQQAEKPKKSSDLEEKTVPLWGAVIIAALAFLVGVIFTVLLWLVHVHSTGRLELKSICARRSRCRARQEGSCGGGGGGGVGGGGGGDHQGSFRPHCLHRLVCFPDATGAGAVDSAVLAAMARLEAHDEEQVLLGGRVKNSHSTSCSACGEGSSSGIGTGTCSSCSAQAEEPPPLPPPPSPLSPQPA